METRLLSDVADSMPDNTKLAFGYGPKQQEFLSFCDAFYSSDDPSEYPLHTK